MIINVNALKEFKDNNFEEEISFDEESYKYSFPIVKINHCLANAKAKLLGEVVEVKLDINADLTVKSSYTLKEFIYKLKTNETYYFSADNNDNDDVLPLKGNAIELDRLIFNLIAASLPIRLIDKGEKLPSDGDGYRVLTEDEYLKEKENEGNNAFSCLDELTFDDEN